jgi:hypothetical protein
MFHLNNNNAKAAREPDHGPLFIIHPVIDLPIKKFSGLYVQVTMHHDKLRIKQPTRCSKYPKLYFVIKRYLFRASSVTIIRSYQLYTLQLVRFMQVM